MTRYAQTNLELLNQLRDLGYSASDLRLIGDAYRLAARLTSGLFRPSGKTFLAHLVGTASVLAEHGAPTEVTAAGLLHASYQHGDFGRVRSGPTKRNRAVLRAAVGNDVERWVHAYQMLRWDRRTIDRLHRAELSANEATVAFMRLANELEDHLDFGVMYTGTSRGRQRSAAVRGHLLVDIARKAGQPGLAVELERELGATAEADHVAFEGLQEKHDTSWRLLPKGARSKLLLSIGRTPALWSHGFWDWLRSAANRISRKARRALGRLGGPSRSAEPR